MEDKINASLITLHKISSFTSTTRIDTTTGDTDVFIDGFSSNICRIFYDSRQRARDMLLSKYKEIREHTNYIMQSNNIRLINQLNSIKICITDSMEGLRLYMENPRYKSDMKIKSAVMHLLKDEIPNQIENINKYLAERE